MDVILHTVWNKLHVKPRRWSSSSCVQVASMSTFLSGTLEMRDWKTWNHEIYGGGKRRTGKRGTKSQGWKTQDRKTWDQICRDGKSMISVYGMRNSLFSVRRTYSQVYYLQFGIIYILHCSVCVVMALVGVGSGEGTSPSPEYHNKFVHTQPPIFTPGPDNILCNYYQYLLH